MVECKECKHWEQKALAIGRCGLLSDRNARNVDTAGAFGCVDFKKKSQKIEFDATIYGTSITPVDSIELLVIGKIEGPFVFGFCDNTKYHVIMTPESGDK